MIATGSVRDVFEVHDLRGLEEIAPEWDHLCDIANVTVFQRPAWLLGCAEVFLTQVVAVAITARDRLVGLLPLVQRQGASGLLLQLLGTGVSDYLDVCIDPAHAEFVRHALGEWMLRRVPRWRELDFQQLRTESLLLHVPAPPGTRADTTAHEPCPALTLGPSLAMSVPRRMRDNIDYYRRRAEARGSITCEAATEQSCLPLLEQLFDLHERRWHACGGGVLRDPDVRALHRCVAPRLARQGLLAMHAVRLDGRVIAVSYGFRDARRVYYYLGGFDPDESRISPGTLAIACLVEQACREGARTLEFLRGREYYKYLWGAVDTPTFRRRFVSA